MTAAVDYSAPADLYINPTSKRVRQSRYMRFDSTAEAIRHAIETVPAAELRGVAIEQGDSRIEGAAIRALYDAPDYPLARQAR